MSSPKGWTKPRVTAAVSVYDRGSVVALGKDAQDDPIAVEKSRVVIYLEGPMPAGDDSSETSYPAKYSNSIADLCLDYRCCACRVHCHVPQYGSDL